MTRLKKYLLFLLTIFQISVFCQKNDSLKILLEKASADTTKCRILNLLIELPENENIWPEFNEKLLQITERNLKTCPSELKQYYTQYYALAINNMGFMAMNKGESKKAIELYTKALNIQTEMNDKSGAAASLINIGYIFRREGSISKAIENYHSALKIYTELKDHSGMGTCYNNIAYIFDNQSQYPEALEYYRKALDAYTKANSKEGMAICYGNIGYMYKIIGNPDCKLSKTVCDREGVKLAIRYLMRAEKIQKELNAKYELSNTYNMLGGVYDFNGDPECVNEKNECNNYQNKKRLNITTWPYA